MNTCWCSLTGRFLPTEVPREQGSATCQAVDAASWTPCQVPWPLLCLSSRHGNVPVTWQGVHGAASYLIWAACHRLERQSSHKPHSHAKDQPSTALTSSHKLRQYNSIHCGLRISCLIRPKPQAHPLQGSQLADSPHCPSRPAAPEQGMVLAIVPGTPAGHMPSTENDT